MLEYARCSYSNNIICMTNSKKGVSLVCVNKRFNSKLIHSYIYLTKKPVNKRSVNKSLCSRPSLNHGLQSSVSQNNKSYCIKQINYIQRLMILIHCLSYNKNIMIDYILFLILMDRKAINVNNTLMNKLKLNHIILIIIKYISMTVFF